MRYCLIFLLLFFNIFYAFALNEERRLPHNDQIAPGSPQNMITKCRYVQGCVERTETDTLRVYGESPTSFNDFNFLMSYFSSNITPNSACSDHHINVWVDGAMICEPEIAHEHDHDHEAFTFLEHPDTPDSYNPLGANSGVNRVFRNTGSGVETAIGGTVILPRILPQTSAINIGASGTNQFNNLHVKTITLNEDACGNSQYLGTNASGTKGCFALPTFTDSDTLGALSCSNSQIAKWNGTAWACGDDIVGTGGEVSSVDTTDLPASTTIDELRGASSAIESKITVQNLAVQLSPLINISPNPVSFESLTNTPATLGNPGQIAQVNTAGNALEFVDLPDPTAPIDASVDTNDLPASSTISNLRGTAINAITAPNNQFILDQNTNTVPTGLWSDGITMYVLDRTDKKIYAYNFITKARDASKDINGLNNSAHNGLWSDGTDMWVGEGNRITPYSFLGVRDTSRSINTNIVRNFWLDGTTMYHVSGSSSIRVWDITTGSRILSEEFSTRDTHATDLILEGIWGNETTIYIAQRQIPDGMRILAYNKITKQRELSKEVTLTSEITFSTGGVQGLWSDGNSWYMESLIVPQSILAFDFITGQPLTGTGTIDIPTESKITIQNLAVQLSPLITTGADLTSQVNANTTRSTSNEAKIETNREEIVLLNSTKNEAIEDHTLLERNSGDIALGHITSEDASRLPLTEPDSNDYITYFKRTTHTNEFVDHPVRLGETIDGYHYSKDTTTFVQGNIDYTRPDALADPRTVTITPTGYARRAVANRGNVWGNPFGYHTASNDSRLAFHVVGRIQGTCTDFGSHAFTREETRPSGAVSNETICGSTTTALGSASSVARINSIIFWNSVTTTVEKWDVNAQGDAYIKDETPQPTEYRLRIANTNIPFALETGADNARLFIRNADRTRFADNFRIVLNGHALELGTFAIVDSTTRLNNDISIFYSLNRNLFSPTGHVDTLDFRGTGVTFGEILNGDNTVVSRVLTSHFEGSGGSETFLGLTDTPSAFGGETIDRVLVSTGSVLKFADNNVRVPHIFPIDNNRNIGGLADSQFNAGYFSRLFLNESECANGTNNRYYGTSSSGVRGCHDLPTSTDTLASLSCSNNEIAKWNGTAWTCASDEEGSGGGTIIGSADGVDTAHLPGVLEIESLRGNSTQEVDSEFDFVSDNDRPTGIWSNRITVWIADNADDRLYAYVLTTGTRDTSKEFDLASANNNPVSIWSDEITMWVVDGTDAFMYAYTLATGTRDTSKEFDLHGDNDSPAGIWSDGTTMWVSDTGGRLYAYTLDTGARDTSEEFDLPSENASPSGIWSDGTTMWVIDAADAFAYAYPLATGIRDTSEEFNLYGDNASARGVWSDEITMWVVDHIDTKVYTYNLALKTRVTQRSISQESQILIDNLANQLTPLVSGRFVSDNLPPNPRTDHIYYLTDDVSNENLRSDTVLTIGDFASSDFFGYGTGEGEYPSDTGGSVRDTGEGALYSIGWRNDTSTTFTVRISTSKRISGETLNLIFPTVSFTFAGVTSSTTTDIKHYTYSLTGQLPSRYLTAGTEIPFNIKYQDGTWEYDGVSTTKGLYYSVDANHYERIDDVFTHQKQDHRINLVKIAPTSSPVRNGLYGFNSSEGSRQTIPSSITAFVYYSNYALLSSSELNRRGLVRIHVQEDDDSNSLTEVSIGAYRRNIRKIDRSGEFNIYQSTNSMTNANFFGTSSTTLDPDGGIFDVNIRMSDGRWIFNNTGEILNPAGLNKVDYGDGVVELLNVSSGFATQSNRLAYFEFADHERGIYHRASGNSILHFAMKVRNTTANSNNRSTVQGSILLDDFRQMPAIDVAGTPSALNNYTLAFHSKNRHNSTSGTDYIYIARSTNGIRLGTQDLADSLIINFRVNLEIKE